MAMGSISLEGGCEVVVLIRFVTKEISCSTPCSPYETIPPNTQQHTDMVEPLTCVLMKNMGKICGSN